MQSWTYKLPKQGNSDAEYEDASATAPERSCFAIADGATESSFAGCWARLLVEDFAGCPTTDPDQWAERLGPLQQRWKKESHQGALPWYAEAKLEVGAAATFLGLHFTSIFHRRTWHALTLGDSCLFQIRGERMLVKFPMKCSADFGSTPVLVNSQTPAGKIRWSKTCRTKRGGWQEGDRFWLMTDALAQWFLRQCEEEKRPWEELAPLVGGNEQAFSEWVSEQREKKQLRNDDTTLVVIEV